jgi:hypothetical protein
MLTMAAVLPCMPEAEMSAREGDFGGGRLLLPPP